MTSDKQPLTLLILDFGFWMQGFFGLQAPTPLATLREAALRASICLLTRPPQWLPLVGGKISNRQSKIANLKSKIG